MASIEQQLPNFTETLTSDHEFYSRDENDIVSALLEPNDSTLLQKAEALEQSVWDKRGYGSLEEYREKYNPASRVFAAFKEEECVGITRIFQTGDYLPPFMNLPFYDGNAKYEVSDLCKRQLAEELGTAAVSEKASLITTNLNLWRIAYRDAVKREVKLWGIIMEPKRVEVMNKHFGLTFKQVGPEIDYQGGMCAAHIMDLKEVDRHMSETKPDRYDWFVRQPL